MKNKKKIIILLIITIIIILLSFVGCSLYAEKENNASDMPLSNNQMEANMPNLISKGNEDSFELIGFGRLEIDNEDHFLNLINPSDNNVYLKFDVIYNDNVLHKTELIEPGKMEQFDIYSRLDAGEHTITYSIDVYDIATLDILWPGIQQKQEIVIKK